MERGGTGKGTRLRSRTRLKPWKSPQSTRTRIPLDWTRCREPVTVSVAPQKRRDGAFVSFIVAALAIRRLEICSMWAPSWAVRRTKDHRPRDTLSHQLGPFHACWGGSPVRCRIFFTLSAESARGRLGPFVTRLSG